MTTSYFNTDTYKLKFTCYASKVNEDGSDSEWTDVTNILHTTMSRGSVAGFFAEDYAAILHSDVVSHVPQAKGYDLMSKANFRPIEVKGFNRNGVDLAPSSMKGTGRSFDSVVFNEDSKTKDFIVADTSNICNQISLVVLPGSYVSETVGNKVTARNRDILFASGNEATPVCW